MFWTVYGGKRDLYTPDARPALLAASRRFTSDILACLTSDALLATPCSQAQAGPVCRIATETRPIRNTNVKPLKVQLHKLFQIYSNMLAAVEGHP
jgi:hypothetical protein